MPKIAFLPIIILWLGFFDVSKIAMVVFDAIFPVVTATIAGIQGVERELIWSARNMGASERELLWQVVLPAALPQILTGLQVALPIAPDRRDRGRDGDGRLRARRRDDDGVALRRLARRVRRHRRDRGGRLLPGQGAWRCCAGGCCCGIRRRSSRPRPDCQAGHWPQIAVLRNVSAKSVSARTAPKPRQSREEIMRCVEACPAWLRRCRHGQRGAAQAPQPVKIRGSWVAPVANWASILAGEEGPRPASRQVLRVRAGALCRHAADDHGDRQQRARNRQPRLFDARDRDPERRPGRPARHRRRIPGRRRRATTRRNTWCSPTARSKRSRTSRARWSPPTRPAAPSTSPCARCCASSGSRTSATTPSSRRRSRPCARCWRRRRST